MNERHSYYTIPFHYATPRLSKTTRQLEFTEKFNFFIDIVTNKDYIV